MSKQMKNFADYFMHGLQLGAGWAEKWQANQIAKERNRIQDERWRKQDERENAKMKIYAHGVYSKAETDRMRAQAALNKGSGKGGGGGGGQDPEVAAFLKEAADRRIIPGQVQGDTHVTNNSYSGSTDSGDTGSVDQPPAAEAGYNDGSGDSVPYQARGGMVRRMAEGGIVGGMSLQEAQGYQGGVSSGSSSPKKPAANPMSAFGAAASNAATKSAEKEKEKPKEAITPTAAPAGGYKVTMNEDGTTTTTSNYNRGGTVRKFASGGRVMEAAIDTGTSGPGSGYGYRAAPPQRRY